MVNMALQTRQQLKLQTTDEQTSTGGLSCPSTLGRMGQSQSCALVWRRGHGDDAVLPYVPFNYVHTVAQPALAFPLTPDQTLWTTQDRRRKRGWRIYWCSGIRFKCCFTPPLSEMAWCFLSCHSFPTNQACVGGWGEYVIGFTRVTDQDYLLLFLLRGPFSRLLMTLLTSCWLMVMWRVLVWSSDHLESFLEAADGCADITSSPLHPAALPV